MQRRYLLNPALGYYKANLHGHTTVSDGKLSPEDYVRHYRAHGYSIVALTDHEIYRYHPSLNAPDFVCLAAYEDEIYPEPVGIELIDREKKTYHLNVYDTRPDSRPTDYEPTWAPDDAHYHDKDRINHWLEVAHEEGLLVCYNHPHWSMQDYRDYAGLAGLWAMEIYNHGCEIEGLYGTAPQVYDEMLRDGQHIYCVASDDNHNWHPLGSTHTDSFGGFTMFNLPSLSYAHVIHGMLDGAFYASMGPQFSEVSVCDGVLRVVCSPVQRICVFTESRRCHIRIAEPNSLITGAEFTLGGSEVYIRVQIQDESRRYGFTRAYFSDDFR